MLKDYFILLFFYNFAKNTNNINMMKEHYISNSVYNLKSIAKSHGLKVEYENKILGFCFTIYKPKFFGLYNKKLKEFIGIWTHEHDFDKKWEETYEYIKNYKDE